MRIIFTIYLLLIFNPLWSQKITPTIISSSGNDQFSSGIYLQWTVGEMIIDFQVTDNGSISEGFHFVDKTNLQEFFPDLGIAALNAVPQIIQQGEILSIEAIIINTGRNETPPSSAAVYITHNNVLTSDAIFIEEISFGSLSFNSSVEISSKINLNDIQLDIGSHFAWVCPDYQNQIEETEENNNCASVSFEIIEAFKPDLILDEMRVDNSCVLVGDNVFVTLDLINQGNNSAPPSVTSIYISTDGILNSGDTRLESFNSKEILRPGAAMEIGQLFTINQNITPGDYFLIACADDFGNIMESDESNNCISTSISIKSNQAECKPDGTIFSANTRSLCVQSGLSIDISYLLANQSPFPTTRSSSISHILSKDGRIDQNDRILYNRFVPSLDPFSTFNIAQNLLIPPNLPEGLYRIFVCFDFSNVIMEENENNNCDSILLQVITPGRPDLTPDQIFLPEACLEYGNYYDLSYRVSNIGKSASEFSIAHYYISTDTRKSSDDIFLSEKNIPNLPLCNDIIVEDQFRHNQLVSGGNYFLLVETDAEQDIVEEAEGNNIDFFPITVKIPDIELNKNLVADQEIEMGCPDTLMVGIENIGNLDADEFAVGVFLSKDPWFTGDDVLIGQDTISELQIYETKSLEIETNIPLVSRGVYYLIFKANIHNNINEANPNNSICIVRIKLIPKRPPKKDVDDLIEYYYFQENVGELNPLKNLSN